MSLDNLEIPPPDFTILPLNNFHRINSIKSGHTDFVPLKNFLKNDALDFQNHCIGQTYVVVDDNEREDKSIPASTFPYIVKGYITLICSEVEMQGYPIEGCERASNYSSYPSVKLARLMVDERFRGFGLGSMLFEFGKLQIIEEIIPRVGCRFYITDAKQQAIQFYQNKKMLFLDTDDNKKAEHPVMFMDLYNIMREESESQEQLESIEEVSS